MMIKAILLIIQILLMLIGIGCYFFEREDEAFYIEMASILIGSIVLVI